MRILFVSNVFPPHRLGGLEDICHETVKGLEERSHACHVLTSSYGLRAEDTQEPGVSRVLSLQADVRRYQLRDLLLHPLREYQNRRALLAALRHFRPDVVFIWGLWNMSLSIAALAEDRMPGLVAYMVADFRLAEPDSHQAYWHGAGRNRLRRTLRRIARPLALRWTGDMRADRCLQLRHVACVSRCVRDRLASARLLPHSGRVIYPGIDPAPFVAAGERRPPADHLRLLYVGGFQHHKGVETLVGAIKLLKEHLQLHSLSVTIMGPGRSDVEARMRRELQSVSLQDEVRIAGHVPRSAMAEAFGNHDVLVVPSVCEEALARAPMEAMAAGCAVVASRVGGMPELLTDGFNGLLVPPGDAKSLAQAIATLLKSRELVRQLAANGRRTVLERFTVDRMVDDIESWLLDIVGHFRTG